MNSLRTDWSKVDILTLLHEIHDHLEEAVTFCDTAIKEIVENEEVTSNCFIPLKVIEAKTHLINSFCEFKPYRQSVKESVNKYIKEKTE